ncbi:MAG: FGGY-family carbohydrate kinase [Rhodospirillales bacterium]|nr:FGGY-family carbohydrate kinase [Rhodospirillales bacterium]
MSCVLAFDLGGTSFRAGLVDETGAMVAVRSIPSTAGQTAEADPEIWWRGLSELCSALADAAPTAFTTTKSIAISAFTRTQVFLDGTGRSTHPALLWHDSRAESVVDDLRAACPPGHPEAARLNGYHPAARLLWLKRSAPAAFAATTRVVEPKDWLNFRLTGTLSGDSVSLARLDAGRSLLAATGISESMVPVLRDPASIVGHVVAGLPGALSRLAGCPVVAMANDTWAAVAGLGALQAGVAYNISGTTEVFGLVAEHASTAEGLLDVVWGPSLHQLGGPGLNGADTVAWILDLLGRRGDVTHALDALLAEPRFEAPLLFLPYLQGERVPFWDPNLRGAFVGLHRRHQAVDFVRAVMEGVAFLNRIVLERAEAGAGLRAREIRIGGGGAASAVWCQIKADILNRPVVAPAVDEPGLLGAAIVARTASGIYPTLAAAQAALVRPGRRHSPDPALRTHYDGLYAEFRRAHDAISPVSRRLAIWAADRR